LSIAVLYGLVCQLTYLAIPAVGLTAVGVIAEGSLAARARVARALWLGLGTCAAILAVWGPQIVTGLWASFLSEQAAYYAHYRLPRPSAATMAQAIVAPMAAFSLPFLIAPLDLNGTTRRLWSQPALLMWLQLVGVLVAAAASNRFYSHYLILGLPAFTVLLALLLSGLSARHQALGRCCVLLCAAVYFLPNLGLLLRWPSDADFERKAAAMIETRIGRGESVLIFDESPMIYFLSESQIAGRYAFVSHYMPSCQEGAMASSVGVLRDGIGRRAKLILLGHQCERGTGPEQIVRQAGYHLVGQVSVGTRALDAYGR
jgi:hypothetical protein